MADAVQPCVSVLETLVGGAALPPQADSQQSLLANILELLACLCEGSELAVQRLSAGTVGSAALASASHVAVAPAAAPVERLAASKLLHILAEDNPTVAAFMNGPAQSAPLLSLLQAAGAAPAADATQASLAAQCHLLGFAGHLGAFSSQVAGELIDALAAVCSTVFSALQLLQGAEALRASIEATTAAAQQHATAVQHNRSAMAASASGAAAGTTSQDVEELQDALHKAQAETHRLRHSWSAKVQTAKLLSEVAANIAAGASDTEATLDDSTVAKLSSVAGAFHAAACEALQQLPAVFTSSGDGASKALPSVARERILVLIACMVSALSNLEAAAGLSAQQQGTWWSALLAATQVAAQQVPETQHALDVLLTAVGSSLASCTARGTQVPLAPAQLQLLTQLAASMHAQTAGVLPSTLPTLVTILAQIAALADASSSPDMVRSLVQQLLQGASSEQPAVALAALDGLVDVFSADAEALNSIGKSMGVGKAMEGACARLQTLVQGAGAGVPEELMDTAEEVLENVAGLLQYKQGVIG